MHPYLMSASSFNGDFHQAAVHVISQVKYFYRFKMTDGMVTGFIGLHHMLAAAFGFADSNIDRTSTALPMTMQQGEISFFAVSDFFMAKQFMQLRQYLSVFCQ